MAAECYVSLKRIEGVMNLSEIDPIEKSIHRPTSKKITAQSLQANFFGCAEKFFPSLEFSINQGELVGIVGPVGSGKSSFLSLFTGCMEISGDYNFPEFISLCPQESWIIVDTVRENILLGRKFEKKWYEKVITACCLQEDFSTFANGDLTMVGERGVTLSGKVFTSWDRFLIRFSGNGLVPPRINPTLSGSSRLSGGTRESHLVLLSLFGSR